LADKDLDRLRVIVLAGSDWSKGVVGLAAGRLAEMFNRPTILLGVDAQRKRASGSARSCAGINLIECLRECSGLLEDFGGHAMAAGVSVQMEHLERFESRLNEVVTAAAPEVELVPTIEIEAALEPSSISLQLARMIAKLDPFGEGNPEPVFVSRGLTVEDSRLVGNGSHLKLQLVDAGKTCSLGCIGFGMGELRDEIAAAGHIDICYHLRVNAYNGSETVQLNAVDVRAGGQAAV